MSKWHHGLSVVGCFLVLVACAPQPSLLRIFLVEKVLGLQVATAFVVEVKEAPML